VAGRRVGPRQLYVVRIALARPLTESDLRLLVDWETGPTRCVWRPVPHDPHTGDVLAYGPLRDAAPAVRLALGWLDSMLSRTVQPRLLGVWPADARWAPDLLQETPPPSPAAGRKQGSARTGARGRAPKKVVQGPAIR
jgi:hypothetical protein